MILFVDGFELSIGGFVLLHVDGFFQDSVACWVYWRDLAARIWGVCAGFT